ncbi:flagellar basal body-associated FliL family protein [Beijerinckia sp. L45]|uniref:flagellar basal body-associated FliL family protein n=1 Tax=Beijerinckia sp. L45 TaxID=1641855 RepID=UPI00131E2DDE|nr:flagellar basal body-associated FliL family protein [Beijerinckia sp. L45]
MAYDTVDSKAGKGSMLTLLAQVGALTILGAVGGGFVGTLIVAKVRASVVAAAAPAEPVVKKAMSEDVIVKELPPIVTNLAQPEGMKIRLQASILFNKKEVETPTLMSAQITDDLVGYLKTLSIAQLQGGSGLQSLREDLNERVAIRSEGHVRELIIETLVVQ